jgi:hypothetical protein
LVSRKLVVLKLLNKEQSVQVSDTTILQQGYAVGDIKIVKNDM